MRAPLVAALAALAACGGRGLLQADGAVERDVADATSERGVDAASVEIDAAADSSVDAMPDVAVDLGAPDGPLAVLAPILAKVGTTAIDVPSNAVVDDQFFYFVSRIWEGEVPNPWSVYRVPFAGGTPAPVTVTGAVDDSTQLGVVGGVLYYWPATGASLRGYDLKSGVDTLLDAEDPVSRIRSVKIAADGIYWLSTPSSLRRLVVGGKAPETLTDTLDGETIVAIDGGEVFFARSSLWSVWTVATKKVRRFSSSSKWSPILDGDDVYVLGSASLLLVPRAGDRIGRAVSSWTEGAPSSDPVRVGSHLVWRVGVENRWLAYSLVPGVTVPLAGLEECGALLQGGGRLFCVSGFRRRLFEVTLVGL